MPYNSKRKRAEYMVQYRRFQKHQTFTLRKAIQEEKFDLAKAIIEKKPSISITEQSLKRRASKRSGEQKQQSSS